MKRVQVVCVLVVFIVLVVAAAPVMAAPLSVSPREYTGGVTAAPATAQLPDWVTVFFPEPFVKALVGLALVIVVDVVLGVAVALVTHAFEFNKLANFYGKVLACVLGWAVLDVVLRLAAAYQIPIIDLLQPYASTALYLTALTALAAQVGLKFVAVRDVFAAR